MIKIMLVLPKIYAELYEDLLSLKFNVVIKKNF